MSYRICTPLDIDTQAFRKEFAEKGIVLLGPTTVTRMVEGNSGLLVHNDEEHCWIAGEDELPEWVAEHPDVTFTEPSPPVTGYI